MTRKDLIAMTQLNPSTPKEREVISAIRDLLENNVIVPIGENRHPYADVLHEWIEGAEIQQQFHERDTWYDRMETAIQQFDIKYRIKPLEPVYEWQWITIDEQGVIDVINKYYTREEFENEQWQTENYTFVKIEETKRERK